MTPHTPDSSVTDPADAGVSSAAPSVDASVAPDAGTSATAPPIVDFSRAGRRVRRSALVLGSLALAGWVVTGLAAGGLDPTDLGAWGGLMLLGMFLVEVFVVGGSALRGMLNAGDRGERLAGGDVGLLPPQLKRGRASEDDGRGS